MKLAKKPVIIGDMDQKLTKDEKKALRQDEWREKLDKEKKDRFWKSVALWSLGGMLLVLALWALVIFSSTPASQSTSSLTIPAPSASDYQSNPTGAKATLTEYADFQCPACKAYYPIVKQVQENYGNKLNVVYRFFPLKTIHQNAVNSAKAAYAAGKQGKFWDMHDKLFVTQDSWATVSDPESTFIVYAKSLNLNTDQFKKDYQSAAADAFVNTSYDNATAIGLNSTPTFFLNGKQIDNPQGYAAFKTVIDKALAGK